MYSLCLRDYASDGVSARVTKMHLRSLQCVVQPFNHQHVVRLFLNRHRVQCIVNTSSDNPTPVHTVSILSPISAPPPVLITINPLHLSHYLRHLANLTNPHTPIHRPVKELVTFQRIALDVCTPRLNLSHYSIFIIFQIFSSFHLFITDSCVE